MVRRAGARLVRIFYYLKSAQTSMILAGYEFSGHRQDDLRMTALMLKLFRPAGCENRLRFE